MRVGPGRVAIDECNLGRAEIREPSELAWVARLPVEVDVGLPFPVRGGGGGGLARRCGQAVSQPAGVHH
ncbi:hypothetical protein [Thermogemmatispora sp.]|uniref:hypothetical protein n=1 Tax=Thermogemmatispora sp. TaxID=1968838 RepID=UPI0035E41D33